MIQFKEFKIDFDHLEELDDLVVVPCNPTAEESRQFSEFLKAYREKEARSKKARPIPSRTVAAVRKKARAK